METIKKLLPKKIADCVRPYYHLCLSYIGAHRYRHPSKELIVIGVTGTKGKSSVTELISHILREAGHTVAIASTIKFQIADQEERNLLKMTMPGRFFLQKFLRDAVSTDCTHAIIEMTSEGAKLNRHRFIHLDALVFTNLSPEHIESHGSFEAYKNAKLQLVRQLELSQKKNKAIISNIDDEYGADFINCDVPNKIPYSLNDLKLYSLHKDSSSLIYKNNNTLRAPLIGLFNIYNMMAAIKTAEHFAVSWEIIEKALRTQPPIKGRVELFKSPKKASKQLTVVVDYAHTPDSLEKIYQAFPDTIKIGVLGNTGGGRDTWKRPEMASIAEHYCTHFILTNEDPYDEDPEVILADMYAGVADKEKVTQIIDRRSAIAHALEIAPAHSIVFVTGKGTDPYIMGPNGTKETWSDAQVVQELLHEL